MSVIGLVGTICSGKSTLAQFIKEDYSYRVYDFNKISDEEIPALSQQIYNSWSIPTIVLPITNGEQLKILKKRNYFHLIYLDSPLHIRYKRYVSKYGNITFEEFVDLDDKFKYDRKHQELSMKCKVYLTNNLNSIVEFKQQFHSQINFIIRPFRPNWDVYFMKIAYTLKQRSNCMKKSVGALLVDQYYRIQSTSYNGTPKLMKNCNEGGCLICKESHGLDLILYKCMCIHAEEGCILEKGMTQTRGTTLYTTLFPCVWCCKALLQAGVSRIVYGEQGNWELSLKFLGNLIKYEQMSIEQYIY